MKAQRPPFTRTQRPTTTEPEQFTAAWWRRAVPPNTVGVFDGLVKKLQAEGLDSAYRLATASEVCMDVFLMGIIDRGLRGESPRGDSLTQKERKRLLAGRRALERERDALVSSLGLTGWQ